MYSLYRSFCSFVIALKERDLFITCATQNGLNPALPGSSPRLSTDPRTRACRLYSRQTRPVILRTGSYVGLSDTDRHFDNVVNSLKYSGVLAIPAIIKWLRTLKRSDGPYRPSAPIVHLSFTGTSKPIFSIFHAVYTSKYNFQTQ